MTYTYDVMFSMADTKIMTVCGFIGYCPYLQYGVLYDLVTKQIPRPLCFSI